jgi:hypothetical protein
MIIHVQFGVKPIHSFADKYFPEDSNVESRLTVVVFLHF